MPKNTSQTHATTNTDPDAAYIRANIHDPEAAARLLARVLALKRLLRAIPKTR